MQHFIRVILCIGLLLMLPLQSIAFASAPYKTETLSSDGGLIETQTAFTPLGEFLSGEEVVNPEDIYSDADGYIYVADSGTKKVIIADENGNIRARIGEGVLEKPTGVFVDDNGDIFVADYAKEKVFRFNSSGELKGEFGKPDSPLFGKKSPYKPQKVGVDRRGNLYVISEGSTNGIIQLSQDGSFLGYYGVNNTEISFKSVIQNLLTTETQKSKMFMKTPPAPDNIALDKQGLIYSVTEGTENEVIKKLNVAGKNMLDPFISWDSTYQDITVDKDGNIFTLNSTGEIHEFDSFGNLLFVFGGTDDGSNRLGLFKQPTGITIDQNGKLYITDKERGMITVLEATAFAGQVHKGIALFKEGLYVESQQYWESVLELNSSFGLAHTAMGKSYYKQQDYEKALEEYKFAEDVYGYSDAFWEVRQAWMQENLSSVLLIMIGLIVLYYFIKYLDKKRKILDVPRNKWNDWKTRKLLSELLFLFKFFKHPIDSFYYLKRKQYATVLSATILYIILFIEYLIAKFQTGFIFSYQRLGEKSLLVEILIVFVPLLLFILINYMVSTINDGEGRFKDIYIGTIYSLAPYLVFIIPITILSNVLTYNESFIYIFSIRIIYVWCLIILFIMIQEIHNYTFSETVRNIFVTLFGMAIMILVVFIVFVLFDQVYDFVYSIMKEVMMRV
ncbi:YIP1 family protein [Neobacillus drentensis]|uniref:YIP1 family protein n=1 Tax=Neobacillus drentensis TaxID=220684 RepID=UPI002FFD7797